MSPVTHSSARGLILGIDYGTSTTLISWDRTGQRGLPQAKLLELGRIFDPATIGEDRLLLPSTLAWPRAAAAAGARVGRDADASLPQDYVILRSLKRCIRCTHDKTTGEGACFNEQNKPLCAGLGKYQLGGRLYHTRELIEIYFNHILRHLTASDDLPISLDQVPRARLGVPGDFTPTQRDDLFSTLGAIALRGLHREASIEIVEEPVAALRHIYAHLLGDPERGLHVVVDIGGGTTDIAIFSYISPSAPPETHPPTAIPIAGDDFDEALFRRYRSRFVGRSDYEIREILRSRKHDLGSGREIADFPLNELLQTLRPVAGKIRDHVFQEILKVRDDFRRIGFPRPPSVVSLYLVGGGSRLHFIDEVFRSHPQYETLGRPPLLRLPDTGMGEAPEIQVVSLGLSIERSRIHPVNPAWLPSAVRFSIPAGRREREQVGEWRFGIPVPTPPITLPLTQSMVGGLWLEHWWQDEEGGELLSESKLRNGTSAYRWLQRHVPTLPVRGRFCIEQHGQLVIQVGERIARFHLPWRGKFTEQRKKHEINEARRRMGYDPIP